MYQFNEGSVVRNEQSTISYTWICGNEKNNSLCIMLPGLGYTTQRPLFHYATSVCMNENVDILHINYNYLDNEAFKKLDHHDQDQWIYEDVKSVVTEVLNDAKYEIYFILSKSIGTIPMAYEWNEKDFISGQNTYGIWLTPLIKDEIVYNALLKTEIPSLYVIGTDDPHYVEELIVSINENINVTGLVIPNANHGLEVKGDIHTTINIVHDVMESIEKFIKKYK
ncbi:alpha/beta family hydrolase [Lederbergia wuyishanensis]|uniref:KANL3/Tex30 alpha/beta hydrolase-like domain-containing protein n=1 Tax=Lederbergia wuyishanensis TaxID=1347903 RepID=A0ABU0D4B4_9BACI|nr:alpha/beta family hydrolase [Lederbergia wuyishanensis]MCJ8008160.1 hypothetical protein [Lederbergia wuyishanensis]MDQ0343251.1 hypothetical protein [Lederbergia wuyishanensis]